MCVAGARVRGDDRFRRLEIGGRGHCLPKINGVVQRPLIHEWENTHHPALTGSHRVIPVGEAATPIDGEKVVDIMVIVHRQADLLEMIATLGPTGRFTGLLYRRQQQGDQDRNDGDHYQQLDQCERGTRDSSAA